MLFGNDTSPTATISFKTWEYDPRFAIRSWAYILIHALPGWVGTRLLGWQGKVSTACALRIGLFQC